ncbi:MAG: Ig-like domain-containing protein, partial [Candidatus Krumholzibacteria bacterium]|nr:Ig-like domain-containing protein [Candidatus Krumholzibacteria bacterium]
MKDLLSSRTRLIVSVALFAAVLLSSCEEDPTDGDEVFAMLRIKVFSGNNQVERVKTVLPDPLVVQVTNILGNPRPGTQITFSTEDPNADVTPSTSFSDDNGFAQCNFRLGTEPGAQHIRAAIEGHSAIFTETAEEIVCPE